MIEAISVAVEKVAEASVEKAATFFDKLESAIEVAKPEIEKKIEVAKKFWDSLESDYPSTYKERIDKTPEEGTRGHWEGERGESKYIPSDERIRDILGKYGMDGIEYKDGIPDFSQCAEAVVEIDDMSEKRLGKGSNFEQADQKCAERWNEEGRDGKTDWTARDVANYRRPPDGNGATVYTWHECNDRKTCQLVRTEINDFFGHLGGVGECKRANLTEGGFDE